MKRQRSNRDDRENRDLNKKKKKKNGGREEEEGGRQTYKNHEAVIKKCAKVALRGDRRVKYF